MIRRIRQKKGDATDPLIILLILFFLAVSFIVVLFINTKIQHSIIGNTALNESQAYSSINSAFENVNVNVVQRGFIIMFAIMVIFMMASAFLFRTHPIFIFLYIIMLAVTMFVAVFIGNVYNQLSQNAELAAIMATQPMINLIMNNIVKVIMALGGLSMLIVFSKIVSPPVGTSGGGDL